MYKRVVVPLDGSALAEGMLNFIIDIAGPLDLEVVLLRVAQPVSPVAIEATQYVDVEDEEVRRAEMESYLRGLAATLESRGVRVKTRIRRGDPVNEILAAARDERADLIAMTTHGRTGPARVLLGSIAESVLRHADVPVFLLRHTERDVARRFGEAASRA